MKDHTVGQRFSGAVCFCTLAQFAAGQLSE